VYGGVRTVDETIAEWARHRAGMNQANLLPSQYTIKARRKDR
jgi:hypothetical protein